MFLCRGNERKPLHKLFMQRLPRLPGSAWVASSPGLCGGYIADIYAFMQPGPQFCIPSGMYAKGMRRFTQCPPPLLTETAGRTICGGWLLEWFQEKKFLLLQKGPFPKLPYRLPRNPQRPSKANAFCHKTHAEVPQRLRMLRESAT